MRNALAQEVKSISFYVLILVATLVTIDTKVNGLKADINTVVRVSCMDGSTVAVYKKYNDAIQAQVDEAVQAQTLNLRAGLSGKAALNAATAARLRGDKIALPKQDCSKPLLP